MTFTSVVLVAALSLGAAGKPLTKAEQQKAAAAKAAAAKAAAAKADAAKGDAAKTDADPAKADAAKPETSKVDSGKSAPANSPGGKPDAPKADAPRSEQALSKMALARQGHQGTTACASCHATSSWSDVRFNHERTGYPLTGKHAHAACKACHASDFNVPVPTTCLGCHRDVHSSELGTHCESCHETADWRSRFDADAHRRTNFPLIGAHAALPCVECHAEERERHFSRATVDCMSCHQAAVMRTVGGAVDHQALGFTQSCLQCHTALAFSPARFPNHDDCFNISAGHAGLACTRCHSTLIGQTSSCKSTTGTAGACKDCHTNTGGGGKATATDAQHVGNPGYPGYSVSISRCIDCHLTPGHTP